MKIAGRIVIEFLFTGLIKMFYMKQYYGLLL